ncbi:hypothetical protein EXU57_09670 [Segetibacter sp. 3557_3]|uniref:hypothetical protein n=1 Tax=Segetibacter sp. 3557_3 TaxID=2547429 RepID=UPI0010589B61|nr:hypothetical protein [Segetibacter sp. 3557_3]TDH27056.1 hypothetical protein EXU57_09670 [Segetibacter sp. 3557_3]
MRRIVFLLATLITLNVQAQKLAKSNFAQLVKAEDTLKTHARNMIVDRDANVRFAADSQFIRSLVRLLRTPYSFDYPFDSLETVSRVYAPDSTFRVFSWQYTRDDNYYRQRGAIQVRTADGSLKLFPLLDMSEFTTAPQDSVRTPQNWIGAIYYGIIMKTHNNKKYYTLLGFDDNNLRSTKKWIEVLTFDEADRPMFGGPKFTVKNDQLKNTTTSTRFCLEYKKEGRARMNYDREMDMIVFDHLISEDNTPDRPYTMVPDGDYEGFKWADGRWVHVEKVFDFKLKDGEAPIPEPLKDDKGKSNEEKLLLQSEKNMNRGKPANEPATTTPKKTKKKGS